MEGQYVGRTTQKARNRWSAHGRSVNPIIGEPTATVGKHYSQPGHSVADMQCLVIEVVKDQDPFILEAREHLWINKYHTHGLNIVGLKLFDLCKPIYTHFMCY